MAALTQGPNGLHDSYGNRFHISLKYNYHVDENISSSIQHAVTAVSGIIRAVAEWF